MRGGKCEIKLQTLTKEIVDMCTNEIPCSSQNLILADEKIRTLLYFELKKCLNSLN